MHSAGNMLWINHASFQLSFSDVCLVTDPWLEGLAFDNSWSHLSKTKYSYDDFAHVTHLWISHEHPDHFSPLVLKKIKPEYRAKIVVLYQKTHDKKVKRFCEGLAFKEVRELDGGWEKLGEGFEIWCEPYDGGDSWSAYRVSGKVVLNLNDCVITDRNTASRILEKIKVPVDILMTQFSYASWVGNPEDTERRKQAASEKFDRIRVQVEAIQPQFVIPFASFVYFCHEDNSYMNDFANRAGQVVIFIEEKLNKVPVVLYPGERWELGTAHDSQDSVRSYEKDFEANKVSKSFPRSSLNSEELLIQGQRWQEQILARNPLFRFLPIHPVWVRVIDLGLILKISKTTMESESSDWREDIAMYSDALSYCFKQPWGMNTLNVNGRFHEGARGASRRFFRLFAVSDWNNRGEYVTLPFLLRKIRKKASQKLKSYF